MKTDESQLPSQAECDHALAQLVKTMREETIPEITRRERENARRCAALRFRPRPNPRKRKKKCTS